MLKNNLNEKNLDVTPKRDVVFKLLLGTNGSESMLKNFLESLLDIKIDDLILDLSTELLPEFYEGRLSRVDVRAMLSDGTNVNIEMQMKATGYSDKRCLQHWSKLYSNSLSAGNKYTDLKKTICIWILNENIFPEYKDFESKYFIQSQEHPELNRFSDMELYFFELPKFRKCDKLKPTNKNFWLWFIDNKDKEMIDLACSSNEEIAKARKKLEKIYSNHELMEKIRLQESFELDYNTDVYLAKEEGMKEGIEQGVKTGKKEQQIEIAKKMKARGDTIQEIAELTGLSPDEIEKL